MAKAKSLLERASPAGHWVLEELGLLGPTGRLVSGHRVYANEDLRRSTHLTSPQLGLPLSDIAGELENPSRDLADTIGQHSRLINGWLAIGRHRERMITVRDSWPLAVPAMRNCWTSSTRWPKSIMV